MLAPSALAQKGDWQAVKNLSPGTKISVRYTHFPIHNMCIFQGATDDQLVCERILRGPSRVFIPPEAIYDRKRVREVHLENSDAVNTAAGVAIGAGAGAALGALNGNGAVTRGGGALLLGGIGGIVGGFAGRDFPIVHGRVVYRR